MGYIKQTLMDGEDIVYSGKLHWIVFLWPLIVLLMAFMFLSGGDENTGTGIVLIIIAIVMGIASGITYMTSEFAVTNKRVLVKVGFIRRNSLDLLLNKVEGIGIAQGIIARILGYGTMVVTGTGGTKEPFKHLSIPLEFRKQVQNQIARFKIS